MGLTQRRDDMELCHKCSACKFIPLEKVQNDKYINTCPSISRYNFHAYSCGGRIAMALAKLDNRYEYSDKLLEVVYNCQMCGACDISCKYSMDMEVLDHINEFRIDCVQNRHTAKALDCSMECLRSQDTMVAGVKSRRGKWAEGLNVPDFTQQKTEVVFHAGCRTAFDSRMWKVARAAVNLVQKAGGNIGIAGNNESCCGGRAYGMGYKEEFLSQAKLNLDKFQKAGVKTLVTGCAECFQAFKVLYDRFGLLGDIEVFHTTQYFDRLIKSGKIKPVKEIRKKITYQDPCYLGRLGESWIHWEGKKVPGHMYRFDPPKPYRRGTYGVYEPPRDILRSIPGLQLVEMPRTREYAWCCGAGGGVKETNPQFALWTAQERLEEAKSSGVQGIATACPGCLGNLRDAIQEGKNNLQVFDVIELLQEAI